MYGPLNEEELTVDPELSDVNLAGLDDVIAHSSR